MHKAVHLPGPPMAWQSHRAFRQTHTHKTPRCLYKGRPVKGRSKQRREKCPHTTPHRPTCLSAVLLSQISHYTLRMNQHRRPASEGLLRRWPIGLLPEQRGGGRCVAGCGNVEFLGLHGPIRAGRVRLHRRVEREHLGRLDGVQACRIDLPAGRRVVGQPNHINRQTARRPPVGRGIARHRLDRPPPRCSRGRSGCRGWDGVILLPSPLLRARVTRQQEVVAGRPWAVASALKHESSLKHQPQGAILWGETAGRREGRGGGGGGGAPSGWIG
mmetsp:Transcript_28431/g.81914  ORF Transcript_28431/g.81914 Transcript_28431/m.81914 type:complete len:272 (-) Transcript_28431:223-1038(-)